MSSGLAHHGQQKAFQSVNPRSQGVSVQKLCRQLALLPSPLRVKTCRASPALMQASYGVARLHFNLMN
jgi:hypothetical protein